MISFNEAPSNKEDWTIQFSATDEDTGNAIVWTGASIAFRLKDANGCTCIDASTDLGTITLPDPAIVEILIPKAKMNTLCAGSYPFGCVYELNSTTAQAFTGTASVYDGIASL